MSRFQLDTNIRGLIEQGAIFYVSHSAGKDSQAMYSYLVSGGVPLAQIVVVHADLGEVEWAGVQEHIRENIYHELHVVRAAKSFLGMVEKRGMWPSSAYRQCTSDLKRDPLHKLIRNDLKARGLRLAVNCTGIRAEESSARSKKNPFTKNKRLSTAGREVYEWMPIFHWTTEQVFQEIDDVGQVPHPAYAGGNQRLSCMFCIMGCRGDLQHAARENPALYAKYVAMEKRIGHTMFTRKEQGETVQVPLTEITGIPVPVRIVA